MAKNKISFIEGASINKPLMFGRLNCQLWKVRMKLFIWVLNLGILDVIVNGPYIPKIVVNGEIVEKHLSDWTMLRVKGLNLIVW